MAYDKSSGLITAPVSIRDLQRCLRTIVTVSGRRYISCDLGYIIANGTINKWAKFKPFRHSDLKQCPVLDNRGFPTKQTAVGSHYRNLVEANCGLQMNFQNYSFEACVAKVVSIYNAGNDDDVWTYLRPEGGANQPFRLVDFAGYLHTALPFMWQSNVQNKKIPYRGSESADKEFQFNVDFYDSRNETIDGMIEPSDLQDTLYNGDNLHYVAAICHPYVIDSPSSSNILAYDIAYDPISSIDGKSASFTLHRSGSNWSITHNSDTPGRSSGYFSITKFKVIHMLAKATKELDGSYSYTFLPMPYNADFPPITDMEIQSESTSVTFDIIGMSNYVTAGTSIDDSIFPQYDPNQGFQIPGWSGLTVKLNLINSSYTPVRINLGTVYCETNCHGGRVMCEAVFDANRQHIADRSVLVPARTSAQSYGSLPLYLTFKDVFDFDTNGYRPLNNTDVEITFWGEDGQGQATINAISWGNDGTIIYQAT